MVALKTQRDRRAAQKLPFCYLCGELFDPNVIDANAPEARTREHVPPESCFRYTDRDPLILPAHRICNGERSVTDKQIGQLIGVKFGRVPTPRDRALHFQSLGPRLALTNVNVHVEVWRWIRAFHAALYAEHLPKGFRGALSLPFPSGLIGVDGQLQVDPIRPQHAVMVQTIKLNRAVAKLDVIRCNHNKLVYECTWCPSDRGDLQLCIFALDLYGWKDLGDPRVQPHRGCVGFYTLPTGAAPAQATQAATTSLVIPNYDALDPFSP